MDKQVQSSTDKIIVEVDEDLEDLIPGFLERRQQDLQIFQQALTKKDFTQIKQLAHTLKGTGGGYGFAELSDIGQQIEQAAASGDDAKIDELLLTLAGHLEHVEVVFV